MYLPIDDQSIVTNDIFLITLIAIDCDHISSSGCADIGLRNP